MAAPSPPATRASDHAYAAFVLGAGSWFAAMGMQSVLFAWLVVGELRAGAETVGWVQSSAMLPALALLLVGGATADRHDTRALLVRLHAVAALPALVLAAAVAAGRLSVPVLVAYGIAMGCLGAFVMPARDTLLSRVAGDDLMRAVTGMTAAQFGAQALGSLLAGAARAVGSAPMLAAQALVLLLGSWVTHRVPAAPPEPRGARVPAFAELTAGLRLVAGNPRLRWPFVLVVFVGTLFVGPFLVCFPLLVRDVYGGDALQLAIVLMLFPLGTITGSLWIRARGGIRRKGLAALIALGFGATNLALIGSGLPFPLMIAATLAWGVGGSVFINCSRTLFQESAPAAERARVLSIYQLGFMGAAPLGANLAGIAAAQLGLLTTLQCFAAVMACAVLSVGLLTGTRRMES